MSEGRVLVTGIGIRNRPIQHKSDDSTTTNRSQVSHLSTFPPIFTYIGQRIDSILSSPLHLQPSLQPAYNDPSHPFNTMKNILSSTSQPDHILSEAVSIIMSIAALENPPGRIVVGNESIEQVKDRVKTVSEELEEFLDASLGADIPGG